MTLTKEVAESIVYNDNEDYKEVEVSIIGQGRWNTQFKGIYKHIPTDKHFQIYFSKGSTECQDEELFYDYIVEAIEVEKKQVMIEQWVKKE